MTKSFLTLLIVFFAFSTYSQDDLGLTTFQMNEINKKSKSGNVLIISGSVAVVLGSVMLATWYTEDDLVIHPDSNSIDTVEKSPVRAISGAILGTAGIALNVGGIIQKVRARRMKQQFIENNKPIENVSLFIKPRGFEFRYNF